VRLNWPSLSLSSALSSALILLTFLTRGSPYLGSNSQVEGRAWPAADAASSAEVGPPGLGCWGARRSRDGRPRRGGVTLGLVEGVGLTPAASVRGMDGGCAWRPAAAPLERGRIGGEATAGWQEKVGM